MLAIAVITYIFNIADMIFTLHLAKEYGNDIEGNPIGKLLLKSKVATILAKVVFVGAMLLFLYLVSEYVFAKILLWVLFGTYAAITAYHIFILAYLKKHDL